MTIKIRKVGKTYKPEYCQKLIDLGRRGKSITQIASALNLPLRTLNSWVNDPRYATFAEAYLACKIHAEAYWEAIGQDGTTGVLEKFNPTSWKKIMEARYSENWRESTKQEIDIKAAVYEMSDEELEQRLEQLKKELD